MSVVTEEARIDAEMPASAPWPLLGDLSQLPLLLAACWYLAGVDGGFATPPVALVGLLGLVAAPVAMREASLLPRAGRALLALWGLGPLVALAFAADRSLFVHPTLTYALMPLMGLAALRLWRREWGPMALGGVLVVSLALYWRDAASGWVGALLSPEGEPRWLALSWHNQTAALMAAFGVTFTGMALMLRRRLPVGVAAVLGAAGLTGVWLTGSRGGLLVTAAGLLVVTGAAVRRRGVVVPLAALVAVAVVATGLVLALSTSGDAAGVVEQPLATRPANTGDSFAYRFYHAEAAVKMFAERPLTGQGIGAYRRVAPNHSRPDVFLTAAGHNEYAEMLGEGGLLFGMAGVGLIGVALLLVVRLVWRAGEAAAGPRDDRLGEALAVGAAGTVATMGVHAAADFDWLYPVLAFLLALALGIVYAYLRSDTATPVRGWRDYAAALPVVALLVVGLGGAAAERWGFPGAEIPGAAPWQSQTYRLEALTLIEANDPGEAREVLAEAQAWNPGDQALRTAGALADYALGRAAADDVTATLVPGRSRFFTYNMAAAALIDGGDYDEARAVLRDVLALEAEYAAWKTESTKLDSWLLMIRLEGTAAGCDAAREAATHAASDPALEGVGVDPLEYAEGFCGQ